MQEQQCVKEKLDDEASGRLGPKKRAAYLGHKEP